MSTAFTTTGRKVTCGVTFTLEGVRCLEWVTAHETAKASREMTSYERVICAASAAIGFEVARVQAEHGFPIDCSTLRIDSVVPIDLEDPWEVHGMGF